jgi:hypothetical protein
MQEPDDTSKNLFDHTTMGDKAMNSEQTGYKEYKCPSCGWVHAAIPRSAVPADSDIADYLFCFNCRAPSIFFVPAGANDAPAGCSLQPVVVPEAWGSSHGDGGAVPTQESEFQHPSYLSLPPPRRGMGEAVLYLDFDGVLHTQDCYFVRKQGPFVNPPHKLFEHMAVLESCLLPYPDIKIVLSTSWVRRLGYIDAASRLSLPLRKRVIGATFHTQMNKREFSQLPRGVQVLADVQRRCPRWWVALDDEGEGWPPSCRDHLIQTDGNLGLGKRENVEQLKLILTRSRHG